MELKYIDDDDRCYGITGMAMSLVIWDADDMLAAVDLDAAPSDSIEFVPDFYFSGNPRISAKTAWSSIFRHFQISMGMTIGNVLCRRLVHHRKPLTPELRDTLLKLFDQEGADACSLDHDEVLHLFNRSYDYLDRVFSHSDVQSVARSFADLLVAQRRLSRSEAMECLMALRGI